MLQNKSDQGNIGSFAVHALIAIAILGLFMAGGYLYGLMYVN